MNMTELTDNLDTLLREGLLAAEKAELEDILFEFEHSDEFRCCAQGYLQSPEHILINYLEESTGRLREFDPVELRHGLLTVLPARMVDLVPRDCAQLIREQIAFWQFLEAAHDFPSALACRDSLHQEFQQELQQVLNMNNSGPTGRVGPGIPAGDFLGLGVEDDEPDHDAPIFIHPEEPFGRAA